MSANSKTGMFNSDSNLLLEQDIKENEIFWTIQFLTACLSAYHALVQQVTGFSSGAFNKQV